MLSVFKLMGYLIGWPVNLITNNTYQTKNLGSSHFAPSAILPSRSSKRYRHIWHWCMPHNSRFLLGFQTIQLRGCPHLLLHGEFLAGIVHTPEAYITDLSSKTHGLGARRCAHSRYGLRMAPQHPSLPYQWPSRGSPHLQHNAFLQRCTWTLGWGRCVLEDFDLPFLPSYLLLSPVSLKQSLNTSYVHSPFPLLVAKKW